MTHPIRFTVSDKLRAKWTITPLEPDSDNLTGTPYGSDSGPTTPYISITEIEGKNPVTIKCRGCYGVLFEELKIVTATTSNDSYTDFYCKTCKAAARVRLHVEMAGEQLS